MPGRANPLARDRHRRPGAARRLPRPQRAHVSDGCARQSAAADAQHRQRPRAARRRHTRTGARRGRHPKLRHGGQRDAVRLQNAPARRRNGQLQRLAAARRRRGGPAVEHARHARPVRRPAQASISACRAALGKRRLCAELIKRHSLVREFRRRRPRRRIPRRLGRALRGPEHRLDQLDARCS